MTSLMPAIRSPVENPDGTGILAATSLHVRFLENDRQKLDGLHSGRITPSQCSKKPFDEPRMSFYRVTIL